jgi:limonene-1,2-epoxide hydrolase
MEYVADDIVYENIGTFPLPTIRGRSATHRFLRLVEKLGGPISIELRAISADGAVVLTERTDTVWFGPRAPASFWVCGRFEVRDGRIVGWRDYYDNGAIAIAFLTAAVKAAVLKVIGSKS